MPVPAEAGPSATQVLVLAALYGIATCHMPNNHLYLKVLLHSLILCLFSQ